ncbi:MAG: type 4a pilus biogenesis protein PilO [Actinomycetota bacterium]
MDRNTRNILLLGGLIIVLVVIGYYFLLLGPLLDTLEGRAQERSDKEAQLAQLQQQVSELESVRREAPEIERQILELSKRIPAQPEMPTLVVQIEAIAEGAGVTQLRIEPGTPGPPPGGGDYSVVPITMAFEGTYEEMQDFMTRLQNLVRLVTVNEVSYEEVEPTEGTTAAPEIERLLQVEIQAEVYYQPETQPGPAPVSPGDLESPQETTTGEATDAG